MNIKNHTFEIQENLKRATHAIEAAEKLLADNYFDFAAARAYYAAFYAATALLLNEDMEFKKHSGVISTIHKRFVKTGIIKKQFGKDLNWLFELRNIGDYGATVHVPSQEARNAIDRAHCFVKEIQSMLYSI